MWLADQASYTVGSANLWLLLISIVSAGSAVAVAWINRPSRKKEPSESEIRDAIDEAVQEYRDTFVTGLLEELTRQRASSDEEIQRQKERRQAAEAEADGYRRRWRECEDARDS